MKNSSVAGTEWQGWSFHKKAVRFQISVSSIASKALRFNPHIWTAVVIWKERRESLKAWTWRVFPEQQQGHLPAVAALWPLLGLWPLAPCLPGHARVTARALLEGLCTNAQGAPGTCVLVLTPAEGSDWSCAVHQELTRISQSPLPMWAKGSIVCFYENWAGEAGGVSNEGPPVSC